MIKYVALIGLERIIFCQHVKCMSPLEWLQMADSITLICAVWAVLYPLRPKVICEVNDYFFIRIMYMNYVHPVNNYKIAFFSYLAANYLSSKIKKNLILNMKISLVYMMKTVISVVLPLLASSRLWIRRNVLKLTLIITANQIF